MKPFKKICTALFTGAVLVGTAVPAAAQTYTYSVDAYSTKWINLRVCSPTASLAVMGDGDTDLDFWVYNPGGREIHEDIDETDVTFLTFNTGLYEGENLCRTFRLKVENLGDVYNVFELEIEAA